MIAICLDFVLQIKNARRFLNIPNIYIYICVYVLLSALANYAATRIKHRQ